MASQGPEFPEDGVDPDDFGNFIRLCRLDLFSGKDKASGGSFGLGKAVYWRFSRLQTVLFNSCLYYGDAVDEQNQNRLFGVNQGVLHTVDGVGYQGRGYFGVPDAQGDVSSVWANEETVSALQVARKTTGRVAPRRAAAPSGTGRRRAARATPAQEPGRRHEQRSRGERYDRPHGRRQHEQHGER